MKRLVLVLTLMLGVLMSMAQIPARVNEIMQKTNDLLNDDGPYTIEMKMSVSMLVSMGSVNIKSYVKGNKEYTVVEGSIVGEKIKEITIDDGIEHWQYNSLTDSLIIIKSEDNTEDSDFDLNLDMTKEYKKASLKERSKVYEITFTDPIGNNKDTPKKTVVKIRKEDYMFEEIIMSVSPAKMTMSLVSFKKGILDESVFILDKSKFPTAKIEYK